MKTRYCFQPNPELHTAQLETTSSSFTRLRLGQSFTSSSRGSASSGGPNTKADVRVAAFSSVGGEVKVG